MAANHWDDWGKHLERLRLKKYPTRSAMYRASGIPENTLFRFERQSRVPRLDMAVDLAHHLDVTLEELAGLTVGCANSRS